MAPHDSAVRGGASAPGAPEAPTPAPKAPHRNSQRDVDAQAATEDDVAIAVGSNVWFRTPVESEWRLGTVHELYFGIVGRALVDDGASTPRWIPIDQRFMAAAATAEGGGDRE